MAALTVLKQSSLQTLLEQAVSSVPNIHTGSGAVPILADILPEKRFFIRKSRSYDRLLFFVYFFALGSFFSTMALRWGRYTWKPMRPSGCLAAV